VASYLHYVKGMNVAGGGCGYPPHNNSRDEKT